MGGQLDGAQDGLLRRIERGEATAAVAHDQVPAAQVEPDVVGVFAQSDGACRLQVLAPEQAHRTVAGACDRKEVGARIVAGALRLLQTSDTVNRPARRKVDSLHAAVAQLGHEQAPAPQVDGHVVDAA